MMNTAHHDDYIPLLTRNDSELSTMSAQSFPSSQSVNAGSDFLEEAASAIATAVPQKKRYRAAVTDTPAPKQSKTTKSRRG